MLKQTRLKIAVESVGAIEHGDRLSRKTLTASSASAAPAKKSFGSTFYFAIKPSNGGASPWHLGRAGLPSGGLPEAAIRPRRRAIMGQSIGFETPKKAEKACSPGINEIN
jgi:hypothetical protein